MPRPEKVQAVAEIKQRIEDADAVFVTEFRGMTVKQLQSLRRGLRAGGADYKVYKMSLARRAADELGLDGMAEHLAGPSALTFAGSDPVAAAKILKDVGRDNESLVIKAGLLRGGVVILPEQVSVLAEIEPREVLLAKIAGAAKAPLQSMAGMLGSFTRNAATMFSQLLEKRESAAPDSAPAAAEPTAAQLPADDAAAQPEESQPEKAQAEPTPTDQTAEESGTGETDDGPAGNQPTEPAESAEEE